MERSCSEPCSTLKAFQQCSPYAFLGRETTQHPIGPAGPGYAGSNLASLRRHHAGRWPAPVQATAAPEKVRVSGMPQPLATRSAWHVGPFIRPTTSTRTVLHALQGYQRRQEGGRPPAATPFPPPSPGPVLVSVTVPNCRLGAGEELRLVGDSMELGGWELAAAPPLTRAPDGSTWEVVVPLMPGEPMGRHGLCGDRPGRAVANCSL